MLFHGIKPRVQRVYQVRVRERVHADVNRLRGALQDRVYHVKAIIRAGDASHVHFTRKCRRRERMAASRGRGIGIRTGWNEIRRSAPIKIEQGRVIRGNVCGSHDDPGFPVRSKGLGRPVDAADQYCCPVDDDTLVVERRERDIERCIGFQHTHGNAVLLEDGCAHVISVQAAIVEYNLDGYTAVFRGNDCQNAPGSYGKKVF